MTHLAQQKHILVVEDEPVTRNLLTLYLSREGFKVSEAENGEAMEQILRKEPVDLVLLDLNLPGRDGLALMRDLRTRSSLAVIIVTAKNDDRDRITGLELGADDYVTKPFNQRELLARIRNLLRRTSNPENQKSAWRFEGWVLNELKRTLTDPEGEDVALTTGEFDLLTSLVRNANRVMSRDELLNTMSNREWEPNDRTVDVMVGRLRRKIETTPNSPRMLLTIRGIGYQFASDVE